MTIADTNNDAGSLPGTVSFTRLVASLPPTVPFTGPETLARRSGIPFTLRLGANESAWGPSPRAIQAMQQAVTAVAWYGDPDNFELRAALAARFGVDVANCMVGAGIDELLGWIVRAFMEPGDALVASLGAYPTVPFHVDGFGGRMVRIPYRDDANDLAALAQAAREQGAKAVYLANPDNPTGTWHDANALRAFMANVPPDCMIILDEAYIEFAPSDALLPIATSDPRVLRLRTFSKAYGMAGARIAYVLGAASVVAAFEKIRLHFGVNRVAQAGALAALADDAYLAEVVAHNAEGRADYAALACELHLRPLPSATNFVAMDVGSAERAAALVAALAARGVFIRMPGAPPINRCIRVTVGTPQQRAAFAAIFRQVVAATP
jgi:histidinol-phosphate aminotransferase